MVRGRALSTWVLAAETPLRALAYHVGVWPPPCRACDFSTWTASASKVLHLSLLESLEDVTQESLFGGQMWGLTHPSPADIPCCPLTLSELGVYLQASLGKSDTPYSLLRDSGPGSQEGATQVILMPPEQLVARKENGPVGLHWERHIPASSQPSEGIRNLG